MEVDQWKQKVEIDNYNVISNTVFFKKKNLKKPSCGAAESAGDGTHQGLRVRKGC